MSKALSIPTYCLPFFSSTITFLLRALFNASIGLVGSILTASEKLCFLDGPEIQGISRASKKLKTN
jgi:hypothetical protein